MSTFTKGCRLNAVENTVTLTAAFAKRAGMIGTAEYNHLVKLRRDNPGLTIQKASRTPSDKSKEENTQTKQDPYRGISYKAMKEYIGLCRNKKAYLTEMEKVQTLSKGQPVAYKFVTSWFKLKFPLFGQAPIWDAEGFIVERLEKKAEQKQPVQEQEQEQASQEQEQTAESVGLRIAG